jgi:hypothetical protein
MPEPQLDVSPDEMQFRLSFAQVQGKTRKGSCFSFL